MIDRPPSGMRLICYAFSEVHLEGLKRQISRLARHLPLGGLTLVYRVPEISASRIASWSTSCCVTPVQAIPYDGRAWEFGAYQLGLDAVGSCAQGVIIANDTLGSHYPLFASELRQFAAAALTAQRASAPTAAGSLESTAAEFSLCHLRFGSWVRSNLFYLNAAAIAALERRLFESEIFAAPRVVEGRLALNVPSSPELASHITRWMAPSANKHNWLGHTGRTCATDELLRDKTGSILLEKRLSSRLLAAGGALLGRNAAQSAWYRLRLRIFLGLRRRRGIQRKCEASSAS